MRTLTCIAALSAALLMNHSAFAASAVVKACRADAKKLCADVKPGRGTVGECMKSHAADLSDGCKEAIAKAGAGRK